MFSTEIISLKKKANMDSQVLKFHLFYLSYWRVWHEMFSMDITFRVKIPVSVSRVAAFASIPNSNTLFTTQILEQEMHATHGSERVHCRT